MIVDTKKLRELAESATPGPWSTNAPSATKVVDVGVVQGEEDYEDYAFARGPATYRKVGDAYNGPWRKQADQDAAFIAAANPQTVIALLDLVDKTVEIASLVELISSERNMVAAELLLSQEQLAAMTAARDEACEIAYRAIEDNAAAMPTSASQRIDELRKVGAQ